MEAILDVVQILLSIALIILIIMQAKGAGLGNLFGGSEGPSLVKTRRGLEKTLFNVTVVLSVIFFLNALIVVVIFG